MSIIDCNDTVDSATDNLTSGKPFLYVHVVLQFLIKGNI